MRHLLAGGKIDRADSDDENLGDRSRSSVPSSGSPGKKDKPNNGFEPEPQPQG